MLDQCLDQWLDPRAHWRLCTASHIYARGPGDGPVYGPGSGPGSGPVARAEMPEDHVSDQVPQAAHTPASGTPTRVCSHRIHFLCQYTPSIYSKEPGFEVRTCGIMVSEVPPHPWYPMIPAHGPAHGPPPKYVYPFPRTWSSTWSRTCQRRGGSLAGGLTPGPGAGHALDTMPRMQ